MRNVMVLGSEAIRSSSASSSTTGCRTSAGSQAPRPAAAERLLPRPRLAQFRRWFDRSGERTYGEWLLSHPGKLFGPPLRSFGRLYTPKSAELAVYRGYRPLPAGPAGAGRAVLLPGLQPRSCRAARARGRLAPRSPSRVTRLPRRVAFAATLPAAMPDLAHGLGRARPTSLPGHGAHPAQPARPRPARDDRVLEWAREDATLPAALRLRRGRGVSQRPSLYICYLLRALRSPSPRVRAGASGAVELRAAVERLLRGRDVLRLAAPRLERRRLQRAPVRERELPRVRAARVHRVQVRGRVLVGLAAGEEDDPRHRRRHVAVEHVERRARRPPRRRRASDAP